jgi:plasmid maintenance system killer protein
MDITFRSKKLEKQLATEKGLTKLGRDRKAKVRVRLQEFRAAQTLADLAPPLSKPARCHELTGDRKGELSVDLDHPYRLIFVPNHDPVPERKEGGLDWQQVTSITIEEIADTHD